MNDIVNHKGYWCKVHQQGWKIKTWESKLTGQREVMAYPRKIYVPLDDIDNPDTLAVRVDQTDTVFDDERKERQKLLSEQRARARAKSLCRRRIKSHDLRQMLTGTYLENMIDFDRARRDFAAFLRIMRAHIPGFRAVYAFETQKRGAWHWHCAVDRLPPVIVLRGHPVRSFDFVRRMWLSVTGQWEGRPNGTVNVDGHAKTKHGLPAKRRPAASLAAIAGYVSKYLTKALGGGIAGRNMWGSTQGLDESKPDLIEITDNVSMADIISMAFACPPGHRVVRHFLSQFGDFWLLYTEPLPG